MLIYFTREQQKELQTGSLGDSVLLYGGISKKNILNHEDRFDNVRTLLEKHKD
jgi:hypothetical protein